MSEHSRRPEARLLPAVAVDCGEAVGQARYPLQCGIKDGFVFLTTAYVFIPKPRGCFAKRRIGIIGRIIAVLQRNPGAIPIGLARRGTAWNHVGVAGLSGFFAAFVADIVAVSTIGRTRHRGSAVGDGSFDDRDVGAEARCRAAETSAPATAPSGKEAAATEKNAAEARGQEAAAGGAKSAGFRAERGGRRAAAAGCSAYADAGVEHFQCLDRFQRKQGGADQYRTVYRGQFSRQLRS